MAKAKVKRPEEELEDQSPEPQVEPVRTVRCPVCDGGGADFKKTEGLTVCKCEDCGLYFQNPRPSLGYLAVQRNNRFKNAMTGSHGTEIKEQSHAALEVMKGFHKHASGREAALNSFGKNVLDVNCEHGFRLREFQKYGWTPYGIDTSRNAVEYAKACYLDVKEAWLDTAGFKGNMFELVMFWDNFGALPDPKQAILKLDEILKPRGLVLVHLREINETFDDKELFYFSSDALRRLFMENGFIMLEEEKDETGFYFWIGRKKDAA